MKKAIVGVLLLSILLGCISSAFQENAAKITLVEESLGMGNGQLAPATKAKTVLLEKRLTELEQELALDSDEGKALRLLIESKKDLAEMQKKILLAEEELRFSPEIDCETGGTTLKAANYFSEAKSRASSALAKQKQLQSSYSALAASVSLDGSIEAIESTKQGLEDSENYFTSLCS